MTEARNVDVSVERSSDLRSLEPLVGDLSPPMTPIQNNGRIYCVSPNGGVFVWAIRLNQGYWRKCIGGPLSRELIKQAMEQLK